MKLSKINPFVRDAEIQNAILEGEKERYAYDHRLFFVLENEGEICIEGVPHRIAPDTLIFIPPVTGYRFHGKLKVALLNFDVTRDADDKTKPICPPVRELFSPSLIFDTTTAVGLKAPLIIPGFARIKEGLLELIRIWGDRSEFSDADTSARLKSILLSILTGSLPSADPQATLCSKVQSYIKLNAEKQISVSSIARQFGYHPTYLGEIFRQNTGITVYQAILTERIRLAVRWLTETDASIDEIAYETGFSSRPHFCTTFKAHMGVTPLYYRKHFKP